MDHKLRNAADLTAERNANRKTAQQRADEEGLARAIRAIETAHKRGWHECSDLTFSATVVEMLRAAGYRVTLQKACGTGDVDTHLINWD